MKEDKIRKAFEGIKKYCNILSEFYYDDEYLNKEYTDDVLSSLEDIESGCKSRDKEIEELKEKLAFIEVALDSEIINRDNANRKVAELESLTKIKETK